MTNCSRMRKFYASTVIICEDDEDADDSAAQDMRS